VKTYRLARVAEAIREVASETILYELNDPRVRMVTVIRTEVSGDLQHAKVFVSIMGTPGQQTLALRGLRHAAGYIQSKLARRLQTRFTPVLQFVLDKGVKNSLEMTRLINEALGKTNPPAEEPVEMEDLADDQPHPPEAEPADGSAEHLPADS